MRKQLFSIHLFMLNRIGPPPLIYPLKSPVFIGGSGDEWLKSILHHPSIMQGINAEPLTKSGKRNSVWLSC